jgi:hypothetical protein
MVQPEHGNQALSVLGAGAGVISAVVTGWFALRSARFAAKRSQEAANIAAEASLNATRLEATNSLIDRLQAEITRKDAENENLIRQRDAERVARNRAEAEWIEKQQRLREELHEAMELVRDRFQESVEDTEAAFDERLKPKGEK